MQVSNVHIRSTHNTKKKETSFVLIKTRHQMSRKTLLQFFFNSKLWSLEYRRYEATMWGWRGVCQAVISQKVHQRSFCLTPRDKNLMTQKGVVVGVLHERRSDIVMLHISKLYYLTEVVKENSVKNKYVKLHLPTDIRQIIRYLYRTILYQHCCDIRKSSTGSEMISWWTEDLSAIEIFKLIMLAN